jgi:hypothetical protein
VANRWPRVLRVLDSGVANSIIVFLVEFRHMHVILEVVMSRAHFLKENNKKLEWPNYS